MSSPGMLVREVEALLMHDEFRTALDAAEAVIDAARRVGATPLVMKVATQEIAKARGHVITGPLMLIIGPAPEPNAEPDPVPSSTSVSSRELVQVS